MEIRREDLAGEPVRALVAQHLAEMHGASPPGTVHALGIEALGGTEVWSAWVAGQLAGIGALRVLEDGDAEIKSMRVADEFLRRGVARALLHRLLDEARARGCAAVWLETGRGPDFLPAQHLYASEGFVVSDSFGDYPENDFSVFMTRSLL